MLLRSSFTLRLVFPSAQKQRVNISVDPSKKLLMVSKMPALLPPP